MTNDQVFAVVITALVLIALAVVYTLSPMRSAQSPQEHFLLSLDRET